ncbi:MAG: hypothetical protein K6G42_08755 [Lachnospiraceae bacterium]|nr:hypothetical protein [Lachnospiraceae bacterium]
MIFDDMKNTAIKKAFLAKRMTAIASSATKVESMAAYILTDRFNNDVQRLIDGDYYFDLPTLILLRKGQSNRKRKVYSFSEENKILLQYLTFMLMEKYDDIFPETLYSFRKNNPVGKLFRNIRNYDPHRDKYVIKTDIRSFGESIEPAILDKQLKPLLADEPELYSFIMWLITRNRYYRTGKVEEGFTSVLPGNPIVSFLQNVFLLEADSFMRENVRICSRYADDICMICEDRPSAEHLMEQLRKIITNLGLGINEEKSCIVPPGVGYDLLGIKFEPDMTDISENTFLKVSYKMKHRANSICRRVKNGQLTREEGLRLMVGYIRFYYYGKEEDGWISWADRLFQCITTTKSLKKLDHLSQECFRYIATGRHTNAKYRFRYEDIRDTGYIPLVRAYYSRNDCYN